MVRSSVVLLALLTALTAPMAPAQTFCVPPSPPAQPPPSDPPCPACEPRECDRCTRSPVYIGAGTYVRDETDLSIRTTGFGIHVARHYDSSRVVDGPMGIGWTSSLTPRLHNAVYAIGSNTNGYVASIVMPDGALFQFTRSSSSGPYIPPLGRRDTLVQNGDGTFSLIPQHSRTVLQFRADGALASMTDEFGNAITYAYDANGRIQRISDGAGSGRWVDVTWNASGRIASATDSAGRSVRYSYGSTGLLEAAADASMPVGEQSRYYSYGAGRFAPLLTLVGDRWNRVVSNIGWDSADRVASYTEGEFNETNPPASTGERYTYQYHPEGFPPTYGPTTIKGHSLGSVWYQYAPATGLVIADGTDYDSSGNTTATYDDDGNKTSYTYDSSGRIWKRTVYQFGSPALTWTYTYDPNFPDKVTSLKSDSPSKWSGMRYEYYQTGDPAPGALKATYRIRSDGVTEDLLGTWTYDARGRVTAVTNVPDQPNITYLYNAAGEVIREIRSTTNTYYDYDSLGRLIKITDPMGAETTYTYDTADRIATTTLPKPSVSSPLDFTTAFTYDEYDPVTGLVFVTATDPNGRATRNGYDSVGNMVRSIDALGAVTTYGYQYGLLSSITDANGNRTTYAFDNNRQLRSMSHPDGNVELYTHSSRGRLDRVTDRRGIERQYTYDIHGRLIGQTYTGQSWPNGSAKGSFNNYDGERLMSVSDQLVDPVQIYEYSYDASTRLASEGYLGGMKLVYAYANSTTGMIRSYTITPPFGNSDRSTTVYYTYDSFGRVKTVSFDPVSADALFRYNARSQYTAIEFGNGLERNYTYDGQGRLQEIANTHSTTGNVAKYTYGYDYNVAAQNWTMLGQRHSVSVAAHNDANQVTGQTTYRYDGNYQLLREDRPNGKWGAWTYDAIGNRASAQSELMPNPAAYNYYTYAGNPNNSSRLMSVSGRSGGNYTYDANGNRANNATWDLANRLVQYSATSYRYDWHGRRAQAATLTYTYRDLDLVRERDTTYNKLNDFLFGPGIDEPLVRLNRLGEKDYYVVDGLGSVTALVDQTGAINEGRAYDAWGNGGGTPTFGYTAREPGPPGLYYRARYYEPTDGRFIGEDPIQDYIPVVGGAIYSYAANSPVVFDDPFGLACRDRVNRGPKQVLYTIRASTGWRPGTNSGTGNSRGQGTPSPIAPMRSQPAREAGPGLPIVIQTCWWTKIITVTQFWRQRVRIVTHCDCCGLWGPGECTPATYTSDDVEEGSDVISRRRRTIGTRGWMVLGLMHPCSRPGDAEE